MRAVVVYESMFGNTRAIADSIAAGLTDHADVAVLEIGEAPDLVNDDIDLLVVGGPTHAFGLSRSTTRDDAAERAGKAGSTVVSRRRGVREWLEAARIPGRTDVAVFDTKIDRPRLPGSAAGGAARRLRRAGHPVVATPQTFYVTDTRGPLCAGEAERAREWGSTLSSRVVPH